MTQTPLHAPSKDTFADLLCTFVVLARGRTLTNDPCWSYIALKPSQAMSFKEACMHGNVNIEDFATILEEGFGENPPDDIRAKMARDFGVRQDLEDTLRVNIEQFQ